MQPRTFESVEEFMRADLSDENACVISDADARNERPRTARPARSRGAPSAGYFHYRARHAETRNMARRAGAAAYFHKPVDDQALLDAVAWALSKSSRSSP